MRSMRQLDRFFVSFTDLVFGVIAALLMLRFVFRLFAANSEAPFVAWLYGTTDTLISPFRGIFVSPLVDGRFEFDITALIALVMYSLIFGLIMRLYAWTQQGAEVADPRTREARP